MKRRTFKQVKSETRESARQEVYAEFADTLEIVIGILNRMLDKARRGQSVYTERARQAGKTQYLQEINGTTSSNGVVNKLVTALDKKDSENNGDKEEVS